MANTGSLELIDSDVMTFLSSLPARVVRGNGIKKKILVDAVKGDIPEE